MDTLGRPLASVVTPANEQERTQAAALTGQVQQATEESVESTCVDQGYTGKQRPEPSLPAASDWR